MGAVNSPVVQAATAGVVLATERFEDCVDFYQRLLGLPVWFTKDELVCLRLGASGYLMIETGGFAEGLSKSCEQNPVTIRFNVEDVRATAATLATLGVLIDVHEYDWGLVATFADPDGNVCELKNANDPYFA